MTDVDASSWRPGGSQAIIDLVKKRGAHAIAVILRDGEATGTSAKPVTLFEIERHRKLGIPFKFLANGRTVEVPVGKLQALERKFRKARIKRGPLNFFES